MTTLSINARPRVRLTLTENGTAVGPAGASAYDIAVQNGFVGTEAEWLASLGGGTGGTVPVENITAYDPDTAYLAGNKFVSYKNLASANPQFQSASIYRCIINTVEGESPESAPLKWEDNGTSIEIVDNNTATIYITGANPLGQLMSITGYKHGDNVVLIDYNVVKVFNKDAVVGAAFNKATNTYAEVNKPFDWTDQLKGGWVSQCQPAKKQLFFNNAADIRSNARVPALGDSVIDISTGFVYNYQNGNYTDDGITYIKPQFILLDIPGAFVKIGSISQDGKVDKVTGKSLIADTEITRLASVNEHYRGTYTTLLALQTAIPVGVAGNEAVVDAGVGADPMKYIWDSSDNAWKVGGGGSVTVDNAINNGSTNAVSGGAVYNAFVAIKDSVVSAGDTLAKLYALILLTASKPLTPTAGKMWKSGSDGNPVETSFAADQVMQLSAINVSGEDWLESESRLMTVKKVNGAPVVDGATELMDHLIPTPALTVLDSDAGWSNEEKTVTGNNTQALLYPLGRTGQVGWLADKSWVQVISANYAASGSATYRRNRAIDCLSITDAQDTNVMNLLDPSILYTGGAYTNTGVSTDFGWDLLTQTKIITTQPCRLGTWCVGGINGSGYSYFCYAISGTNGYWKRNGQAEAIQLRITLAACPTLIGRLLAKSDWATSAYTQQAGDEATFQGQDYYDAATRSHFYKETTTIWEKIR